MLPVHACDRLNKPRSALCHPTPVRCARRAYLFFLVFPARSSFRSIVVAKQGGSEAGESTAATPVCRLRSQSVAASHDTGTVPTYEQDASRNEVGHGRCSSRAAAVSFLDLVGCVATATAAYSSLQQPTAAQQHSSSSADLNLAKLAGPSSTSTEVLLPSRALRPGRTCNCVLLT